MSDVRAWLEGLGLGDFAETFERERIQIDQVAKLTEADLKELGLPMGPRKAILEAGAQLAEARAAPGDTKRSAPTREAERRQITVMFCDLVGSTALSEQLDPEDLRALMQAYQQAAGAVIERYEGHIAQYLGDGLMTYFGWPQAHDDDAERAVRAGLEIVGAVKAVGGAPVPLAVRIGIATGPVVVGETGAGDASVPKLAVGETPNLAAGVQGLAAPDEMVIAPATRRLVGAVFILDDIGAHALKGIAAPVRAWRVSGVSAAESRFEAARGAQLTASVGREAEVALILEKWRRAKDGEGQVCCCPARPALASHGWLAP